MNANEIFGTDFLLNLFRFLNPLRNNLFIFRKTAGARRLVEAHYGRIDPDDWESQPDAPICLEDALKVSLHLLAAHVHISRVFLMVVKLPQVNKILIF